MTDSNSKRIAWIDGVKGIAALLIVLHHFVAGFYPAAIMGDLYWCHTKGDIELSYVISPISVLTNGSFLVCIFLILSGMVLTMQTLNANSDKAIGISMIKRYFRLALPLFVFCIVVWIMLAAGTFYGVQAHGVSDSSWLATFYTEPVPFWQIFYSAFFGILFKGDTTFSNAFWMLKPLFLGSYVAYIIAFVIRKNKLIGNICNIVAFCVLWYFGQYLIACFCVGGILAQVVMWLRKEGHIPAVIRNILGIVLILIGIYLGGYPSYVGPEGFYKNVGSIGNRLARGDSLSVYLVVHVIAASVFVLGLCLAGILQKIFERKLCLKLGEISFSVYLIHMPVIFSIGCLGLIWTFRLTQNYILGTIVGLIFTYVVTLALSFLFTKYVEGNINKLLKKVF